MTMKAFADKAANISLSPEELAAATSKAPSAARTAPGQMLHLQAVTENQKKEISRLESELKEAKAEGSAFEVPLEKLHEVPGRRRYMPPEKYKELVENLRHNKLVNPVVVLPRPDGEWDIWSGHHRTDAHHDLGKPTVWCVRGTVENDVEASDGAFFANLMQSDLTDYEKFVGLKRYQTNHPGLTQAEIAERVGLHPVQVSELFAFARLPAEVLAIVSVHQGILGSNAAGDLALLTEAGKGERVIEAVKQLADKKIDQQQAVKFARSSGAAPKATPVGDKFKVKIGKADWCSVRCVKNVMRLEFKSEDEAQAAREAIRLHLESLASNAASLKKTVSD